MQIHNKKNKMENLVNDDLDPRSNLTMNLNVNLIMNLKMNLMTNLMKVKTVF